MSTENTPALEPVEIVSIAPTRIWIESDLFGSRHVVLQHEGCEPFTYASFGYDWRYTCNAGTMEAARQLALSLGATEPIEQRTRTFDALEAPQNEMIGLDVKDKRRDLLECAIDGALTSGYQGVSPAPEGHWLGRWWQQGRRVREREQALERDTHLIDFRALELALSVMGVAAEPPHILAATPGRWVQTLVSAVIRSRDELRAARGAAAAAQAAPAAQPDLLKRAADAITAMLKAGEFDCSDFGEVGADNPRPVTHQPGNTCPVCTWRELSKELGGAAGATGGASHG